MTTPSEVGIYDSHMHTPLCRHAVGEPSEYAAVASEQGFTGIIFTCHNPTNDGWSPQVRMQLEELDTYLEMVAAARAEWEGRLDVLLGLESDYFPGAERWLEELHGRASFHYVLGSVHPHLPQYRERYYTGDDDAFRLTYFEHLALAAESGLFDCLAHPDLVKNERPATWNATDLLHRIRPFLDRIAATGIAMELNTSGLNKRLPEMNPGPELLREMRERGIPVVVGSDAHHPRRVGADFGAAFDQLVAAGYSHVSRFVERERQDVPIGDLRVALPS